MGEGVPANASCPQVFLFRLARGLCTVVSPEAPSARFLQGLPHGHPGQTSCATAKGLVAGMPHAHRPALALGRAVSERGSLKSWHVVLEVLAARLTRHHTQESAYSFFR